MTSTKVQMQHRISTKYSWAIFNQSGFHLKLSSPIGKRFFGSSRRRNGRCRRSTWRRRRDAFSTSRRQEALRLSGSLLVQRLRSVLPLTVYPFTKVIPDVSEIPRVFTGVWNAFSEARSPLVSSAKRGGLETRIGNRDQFRDVDYTWARYRGRYYL